MKYFGTDGIRREANQFTPEFIFKIVAGLAAYADTLNLDHTPKVLIGGDTRESTEWILQDLSIALETLGLDYSSVDVLPTPAINYCFYHMGFDFAIDVTASHNPFTDNGIKIFERGATSGIKLTEQGCDFIEHSLQSDIPFTPVSPTDRASLHPEAVNLYKEHLLNYLGSANFQTLKIGLDCANGATSIINRQIFEQLGATVELINADQNYNQTINQDCGSTHLTPLKSLVKENQLDFGIAYDGDGDRCLLVDHAGNEVDGDKIIAILAHFLKLNSIAITVMANQGLLNWAEQNHLKTEITAVGDSNVAEAMRTHQIPIGGEQSGHIILPSEPTGDGILTSLMIAKVISKTHQSLSDLAKIITKLPQISITIPATPEQKLSLRQNDAIKSIILQFNEKVKAVNGRLLVRPSGTEPKIRITFWGENATVIATLADELATKLGEIL